MALHHHHHGYILQSFRRPIVTTARALSQMTKGRTRQQKQDDNKRQKRQSTMEIATQKKGKKAPTSSANIEPSATVRDSALSVGMIAPPFPLSLPTTSSSSLSRRHHLTFIVQASNKSQRINKK